MITIAFEDNGQSYLEWDIEGDKVVASRPDGGHVGLIVRNLPLGVADKVIATQPGGYTTEFPHRLIAVVQKGSN